MTKLTILVLIIIVGWGKIYPKSQLYSLICLNEVEYIMSSGGVASPAYTKDGEIKNCNTMEFAAIERY